MSSIPTPITKEIFDYISENFSAEDDFLKQLKIEAAKEDIPEICIAPDQGKFLQFFLKTINAKNVLEIGSLAGYSAIMMARALPDNGKLITLEKHTKNVDFTENMIEKSGLSQKIEVIQGDASKTLRDYNFGVKFDFIFVDADKRSYSEYLELCTPLLRKGGVYCADNSLAFGKIVEDMSDMDREKPFVEGIRAFNEAIKENSTYFSSMATIGDGMLMALKI